MEFVAVAPLRGFGGAERDTLNGVVCGVDGMSYSNVASARETVNRGPKAVSIAEKVFGVGCGGVWKVVQLEMVPASNV